MKLCLNMRGNMKLYTVDSLITKFGSQKALADLCGVTQGRISQMRTAHKLSFKAAKQLAANSKLKINQLPLGV